MAADMVMAEPTIRKTLTNHLQHIKNIQTIQEAIKNDPNHYWHKIKKLIDAIRGKKTVFVRLYNGIEFKIETEKLYKYTGVYTHWGDYETPAGYPRNGAIKKNQHLEFKVDDIKQAMYRGKTIFGTAE